MEPNKKPKYVVSLTVDCEKFWPYSVAFVRWNDGLNPKTRQYKVTNRRLEMIRRAISADSERGILKVTLFTSKDKCVIEFERRSK